MFVLGVLDKNTDNDFQARNGTELNIDSSDEDIFKYFGETCKFYLLQT